MNIFYTNSNPIKAASEHNLIHRNKMIVEYSQLLSTAHHELSDNVPEGIYRRTHVNHPSAIWVRQSKQHYKYVLDMVTELCNLYTKHTGKIHKSQEIIHLLNTYPDNIKDVAFKEPPVAAPDEFKVAGLFGGGVCKAYQMYLNQKFKEWKGRDKPLKVEWFGEVPSWVEV